METIPCAVRNVLEIVFLIFPQYCLGRGLLEMGINQAKYEVLSIYLNYTFQSPLQLDKCGKLLISLTIQGIIYFL